MAVSGVKVVVAMELFGLTRKLVCRVLPVPDRAPIWRAQAKNRYSLSRVSAGAFHVTVEGVWFAVVLLVPADVEPCWVELVSSLAAVPSAFAEAKTRQLTRTVMAVGMATEARRTKEKFQLPAAKLPFRALGERQALPVVPVVRALGRLPVVQPVRGWTAAWSMLMASPAALAPTIQPVVTAGAASAGAVPSCCIGPMLLTEVVPSG